MSFGAVAGAVGGALVTGMMSDSGGSGNSTTSSQTLDPRIANYIYGNDSTTGILPAAADWYNKNSNGLNQQMIDGLNRQYSVYSDPATAQGYTNQQALGQSLLAAPIAGNPFTSGQMTLNTGQNYGMGNQQGMPQMGQGSVRPSPVQQVSFSNPASQQSAQQNPFIYSAPTPMKPPALASDVGALSQLANRYFDGGGGNFGDSGSY